MLFLINSADQIHKLSFDKKHNDYRFIGTSTVNGQLVFKIGPITKKLDLLILYPSYKYRNADERRDLVLLLTSFIGSLVGFYICYQTFIKLKKMEDTVSMRICMINNMSLSFIFAMFVELTTNSKILAIILPTISSCIPFVWKQSSLKTLDIAEITISSLMSVAMSVMLIGMIDSEVIWSIQLFLLMIEILLYLSITKKIQHNSS